MAQPLSNTVWIVQRPKFADNFDHGAIAALGGKVEYLLPAAPNLMDRERMAEDVKRITDVIDASGPSDVFISLGGSPVSQMMFGAALSLSSKPHINYGLYSRGQDGDGKRGHRNGQRGSYRIIPVSMAPEA